MAILTFDSRFNYQKIVTDGSFSTSVADPDSKSTTTINHNLGYKPNARVWFTVDDGTISPALPYSSGVIGFSTWASTFCDYGCWFRIYNNPLEIVFDRGVTVGPTITSTIYYRIYADAAQS